MRCRTMPLSLIDYLILFISSLLGGIILAHIIIHIYERFRKKPIALSYIEEKLKRIKDNKGIGKVEQVKKKFVPILSELKIMKHALLLSVFTIDELSKTSEENKDVIESWIESAIKQSIVEKLSENVYLMVASSLPLSEIQEITRLINDELTFLNRYSSMIINLDERERKKLSRLGIKNIIYIGWDNDLGPKVDYFLYPTRLTRKAMEDPSFLARLMMGSEVSVLMETDEGDKIIIYKVNRELEGRIIPNNLIAEVVPSANVDEIKHYLLNIKNKIEENGSRRQGIESVLIEAIKMSLSNLR